MITLIYILLMLEMILLSTLMIKIGLTLLSDEFRILFISYLIMITMMACAGFAIKYHHFENINKYTMPDIQLLESNIRYNNPYWFTNSILPEHVIIKSNDSSFEKKYTIYSK